VTGSANIAGCSLLARERRRFRIARSLDTDGKMATILVRLLPKPVCEWCQYLSEEMALNPDGAVRTLLIYLLGLLNSRIVSARGNCRTMAWFECPAFMRGFSGRLLPVGKLAQFFLGSMLAFCSLTASTVGQPVVVKASPKDDVPQARILSPAIRLPIFEARDIHFNHLPLSTGLSQTRVGNIVQDDKGFMWFGTQYGLNRFDGENFKVFTHVDGDPSSLSGAYIHTMFKDRSGMIWIATDQYLNRLDPKTEIFTLFKLNQNESGTNSIPIMDISQDHTGALWLSTLNGLYRLDPSTGRTSHFQHEDGNPHSLSNNEIKSAGEDAEGNFWVASGSILDEFDRATGNVTFRVPLPEQVRDFSFHEDRLGNFWLIHSSTHGSGLALFDRKKRTLCPYLLKQPTLDATNITGVYSMLDDAEGNLWLATGGLGLLKLDVKRKRFEQYRHSFSSAESVSEDHLVTLYSDNRNNIWVGMNGKPPDIFSNRKSLFATLANPRAEMASGGESMVSAMLEDHEGNLWLGSTQGLTHVDRNTGALKFYSSVGSGIPADPISIVEDRDHTFWIGTMGGLTHFDEQRGTLHTYMHDRHDPASLSQNVCRVLIDHLGRVWAATWDGLDRLNPATNSFEIFRPFPDGTIWQFGIFVEDSHGILWLGSNSGLWHFNPVTSQFQSYMHKPEDPHSLSDNRVLAAYFDHSGTMWIGTADGLDRLDDTSGRFTTFKERDGLAGNSVSCIEEDDSHALWISTNHGLSRYDLRTRTFRNYSAADNLPGDDFTGWGTCAKGASGHLYFGGYSGGVEFNPQRFAEKWDAPPVVLVDLRISGKSVKPGVGSPLKQPLSYTHDLTLSHNQSNFSLQFQALSFLNMANIKYRYKLDGFDHIWNEVGGDQRWVNYTALSAGSYTFHVQVANLRGEWSSPGTQLSITIFPPWWSTWWVRIIYSGALLLAIWAMYHLRVRQIKNAISVRFDERLAERTRMARELHDTFIQTVQGSKLIADHARRTSSESAQLHKALDELSEWLNRAIEEGRAALSSLRISTTQRNDLADALQRATENGFVPESMTARFSVIGNSRDMHPVVRDEVYRIGYEAIRNSCLHSSATQLEIELKYSRDLTLCVNDNGTGFDPEIADNGKDRHFGLQGMRERAARINSKLALATSTSGTKIKLIVPGAIIFRLSRRPQRGLLARIETLFRVKKEDSDLN
jgi:ligand-binding sensor domain-containing protein/signal transduction histidine kinase